MLESIERNEKEEGEEEGEGPFAKEERCGAEVKSTCGLSSGSNAGLCPSPVVL
jgi:hypothetical protein